MASRYFLVACSLLGVGSIELEVQTAFPKRSADANSQGAVIVDRVNARPKVDGVGAARMARKEKCDQSVAVSMLADGRSLARKDRVIDEVVDGGKMDPAMLKRAHAHKKVEGMRSDDAGSTDQNVDQSLKRKGPEEGVSKTNTRLVNADEIICPTLAALVRNGDIALDANGRASQRSLHDALSFLGLDFASRQGFILSPVSLQGARDFPIDLRETNHFNRICTGIRSPPQVGTTVSPNVTRFDVLKRFAIEEDGEPRLYARQIAAAYKFMFMEDDICSQFRAGGGPGAFAEIPTLLLIFGRGDDRRSTGDFFDALFNKRFLSVKDLQELLVDGTYPSSRVRDGAFQRGGRTVNALQLVELTTRMTALGYPLKDATFRS